jgi:hypothetical protein
VQGYGKVAAGGMMGLREREQKKKANKFVTYQETNVFSVINDM